MIDNLTITKTQQPCQERLNAEGRPFKHHGILYSPKYRDGQIVRYDGSLKNLRLFWYDDKICLSNSIHKYWHGCNYSDFTLADMTLAVNQLQLDTGIDWREGIVSKLEYGFNIVTNAEKAFQNLHSYRGKGFGAMDIKGKVYGSRYNGTDFRIKSYNKQLQVYLLDRVKLKHPILRWEIDVNRMRSLENKLNLSSIRLENLLDGKIWNVLGQDAIRRYNTCIRMQQIHLHKLTLHEKKVYALMLNDELRADLKRHHKDTYKNYYDLFKKILANNELCVIDSLAKEMEEKCAFLIGSLN